MSYFPTDIPFMSDEELIENGLKKPYKKPEIIKGTDLVPVVRCKDCIHNNDCDIQYSAQAGENFFCGFGETEKDVREDVYG